MVRQVTSRPTGGWKALLVILVAGGALLWHLLACTESPMAFSPEGNLAFVTMEPYDQENLLAAGTHAYRLMVLTESQRLRILEETTDHLLSAPAYSPDGKQLCYLRVPLPSEDEYAKLKAHAEERKKEEGPAKHPELRWLQSRSPEPDEHDLTLPPMGGVAELVENLRDRLDVPATLVVRDAATSAVVSETGFSIPLGSEIEHDLLMVYLQARPQFSPDGQSVYFCTGSFAVGIEPARNEVRILAAPAVLAALSPDGTTVAALQGSAIGFTATDGTRSIYRRIDESGTSLGGLTWLDDKTVGIITTSSEDDQLVLRRVRSDGTLGGEITLSLPRPSKKEDSTGIEWAMSRDGRHLVVVQGAVVAFMETGGKVLKRWEGDEKRVLAQPTFTPDSKRVAFKSMSQDDNSYARVDAIVFFTPQGKELSRIAVPRIDPSTTRPATEVRSEK